MGIGRFGRGDDLFARVGPLRAVGDVLRRRGVEQERVLRDEPHALAQAGQRVFGKRAVVQEDASLLRIEEAWHQVGQGCLAGAAGAHDGHAFALSHLQVDVLERWLGGSVVGEADVIEAQLFELLVQLDGASVFGCGVGGVDDVEHALGAFERSLDVDVGRVDALDGIVEQGQRGEKGQKRTCGQLAVNDAQAAVPEHQPGGEGAKRLHDAGTLLAGEDLPAAVYDELVAAIDEVLHRLMFLGEALDDADAGESFLQQGVYLGPVILRPSAQLAHFLAVVEKWI